MFPSLNAGRAFVVSVLGVATLGAMSATGAAAHHHGRAPAETASTSETPCEELTVRARQVASWAFWSRRRKIEVRVDGTARPVELAVRNLTPGSLRLAGGPVQRVRSSGGSPNRALLRATVLGRHGRLAVEPVCTPDPETERLSRQIAEAIEQIEPEIMERIGRLAARGAFSAEDALAVLAELEQRLLAALPAPELAALRAWIEDWIAAERARWVAPSAARDPGAPSPPVVFAAWTEEPPPAGADGFRGRIWEFFKTLKGVAHKPTIDVCVRSTRRADVFVWPKRNPPSEPKPKTTDAAFPNLTRGIYTWAVSLKGKAFEGDIDLVSGLNSVIECQECDGPDCEPEESEYQCSDMAPGPGFVCKPEAQ